MFPSTDCNYTNFLQVVTPRFTIRKIAGEWKLSDSLCSCESFFPTWDEAMSAATRVHTLINPTPINVPYIYPVNDPSNVPYCPSNVSYDPFAVS